MLAVIIIFLVTWPEGYGDPEVCGLVLPTGVLGLEDGQTHSLHRGSEDSGQLCGQMRPYTVSGAGSEDLSGSGAL